MKALVVEGGGMRGAYAAGAIIGLQQAGERFDAVYASSSGACSAAYFAAGQPEGLSIWREHLDGPKLIRASNLLRGRPLLDLGYLVDEVFARRVPLDVAALRRAPHPTWVTVTHAGTGEAEHRDLRREKAPLETLRASAALPFAYGRTVKLDGARYVDGGLADPIPLRRALEDGADEVTVVLTRPRGYRRPPARRALVALSSPHRGARRAMATMHERYNQALDLAEATPGVRVIAPPPTLRLSRLMRGADELRAAVAQGMSDAAATITRAVR
jgi:predicted patatin/cPLA2 family phospholipase